MRPLFSLPFILILTFSYGQDIKGLWMGSHMVEVNLGIAEKNNDDPFALSIPDTVYYSLNSITDLKSKNEVVMKGLKGEEKSGKWKYLEDTLVIDLNEYLLNGIIEKDYLKVFQLEDRPSQTYYFKKARKSHLKVDDSIFDLFKPNTLWKVITDSTSYNFGVEIHFQDSNAFIITQDYGISGYTNWGQWHGKRYNNHFFYFMYDQNLIVSKFFHFYERSGNTLLGENFELKTFDKHPPPRFDLHLVQIPLLPDSTLNRKRNQLIGLWKAHGNPIPYGSIYNISELENPSFEILFEENDRYKIIKKANVIRGEDKSFENVQITGEWVLSSTGKYIELRPDSSYIRYITIADLDDNQAVFHYKVESFEKNMFLNKRIILKKITRL